MNTTQHRQLSTTIMTLTAVAAIGLSAVACGSTSPSPTKVATPSTSTPFTTPTATTSRVPATPPVIPQPAPTALPPLAPFDSENPDEVAAAVAQVWYSWDTTVDLSTYDARVRAVPLLESDLAHSILNFPPVSGPGSDWLELTAQNAVLTVGDGDVRAASETGAPPDTATSAYRLLTVTQKVATAQGPLPDRSVVVSMVLSHSPGGWLVSKVVPR
ncbi:hypothetical protein [Rhodococcus qingshengii]|uniref:hypothetical protein n=1 Tax=Rhodococcus qingshengii TaxID=334542 RepID=UPI001BEBF279|nr:hypothetical protein [Rhodococcus qingshengii]MBT2272749.1 hypothetical protein [Rhodococcus qingshengii]